MMSQRSTAPCGFTLKHYFDTLTFAKEYGYAIKPFRDFEWLNNNCEKYIILRHDIDFSLQYALQLAELEAEHGIYGIYYILLHNDFYNILSDSGSRILRKISDLGHEIGLHVDTRFFRSGQSIISQIDTEIQILENIIGNKITSISQHYPKITPDVDEEVASKYMYARDPKILKVIEYISDSGRNWRSGCMCNHIGKTDKIQILTHPLWWVASTNSRDQTLDRFKENVAKESNLQVEKFRQIVHDYVKEQLHQQS